MKPQSLTTGIVVVADQRNSRSRSDRVPEALEILNELPCLLLPFERTAGDEVQCLTADPSAAVNAVMVLTRLHEWRIGIGIGTVETPLPTSTRAARGDAYVAARDAVVAAHKTPAGLSILGAEGAADAETVLALVRALASRRTSEGWQLASALSSGATQAEVAEQLGISRSAISQRARRAHVVEISAGERLASALLAQALSKLSGTNVSVAA